MDPDDSEVDNAVREQDNVPTPDPPAGGTDRTTESGQSLPEQLSTTVPPRRAYGMERLNGEGTGVGLLSPRERQYLQHAQRMDPPDRDAVENVLSERVGEFVSAEWPVIREEYPDIATALREELCGGGST